MSSVVQDLERILEIAQRGNRLFQDGTKGKMKSSGSFENLTIYVPSSLCRAKDVFRDTYLFPIMPTYLERDLCLAQKDEQTMTTFEVLRNPTILAKERRNDEL